MIKGIIFDFFGVVCPDLMWDWLRANVRDLKNQEDYFIDLADKKDKAEISRKEFYKKISEKTGIPEEKVDYSKAPIEINLELLYLIANLKKKYKIGLLSNSSAEFINEVLSKYDLRGYFDEIVISAEVKHIKPEPEIFEIILNRLGLQKEEVIFTDDKSHNTEAAEKIGIKSIRYENNRQLHKDLEDLGISP